MQPTATPLACREQAAAGGVPAGGLPTDDARCGPAIRDGKWLHATQAGEAPASGHQPFDVIGQFDTVCGHYHPAEASAHPGAGHDTRPPRYERVRCGVRARSGDVESRWRCPTGWVRVGNPASALSTLELGA